MDSARYETLVTRALEGVVVLAIAVAAFLSRANLEALRQGAWCGETPARFELLGHCAACWTDAMVAGLAAAALIALAHAVTRQRTTTLRARR